MIVPPHAAASSSARADLPLAVGPATITTGDWRSVSRRTEIALLCSNDEQIGCDCEERSDEAISLPHRPAAPRSDEPGSDIDCRSGGRSAAAWPCRGDRGDFIQ